VFAVREGRSNVVRVLLKAGADVNETVPGDTGPGPGRRRGYGGGLPPVGATPLLLAVKNAHFQLAAELLEAGANPNADLPGYTVLHLITVVRKPGVGDNDPAPEGSGDMSSLELVKKLAAKGANVNARMTKKPDLNNTRANELGATPFFLAALTADAELLTTLAKLGADHLTNVENSTPLMVAAGLATRSPEGCRHRGEVLEALQSCWISALTSMRPTRTVKPRARRRKTCRRREVPRGEAPESRLELADKSDTLAIASGPIRKFQTVRTSRHP
jgi:hypothetical protein